MGKITTESIIRVQFLQPVAEHGGQTDFYFGSLAAIYEVFHFNNKDKKSWWETNKRYFWKND